MGLRDEVERLDQEAVREAEATAARVREEELAAAERNRVAISQGAALARDFVAMASGHGIRRDSAVFTETYELIPRSEVPGGGYGELEKLVSRIHFADCWRVASNYITEQGELLWPTSQRRTEPGAKRNTLSEWWLGPNRERKFLVKSWDRRPLTDFTVTSVDSDGYSFDLGQFSYFMTEYLRHHRRQSR